MQEHCLPFHNTLSILESASTDSQPLYLRQLTRSQTRHCLKPWRVSWHTKYLHKVSRASHCAWRTQLLDEQRQAKRHRMQWV